jgi:chromosomal replication initiation ATPase DnaA
MLSDLAKARIPKRFWPARLGTYRPETDSQRAALVAVRTWVERVRAGAGPMLALVGDTGTGKSHLLYAAAHELIETCPVFVRPWYSFADQLRYGAPFQSEGGGRQKDPAEIRGDWYGAQVVMLDEVRRTSGTEFDDSELARFACHAWDHERAVLITSNVNPLSDVVGPAAASRFAQIVVAGADGRVRKAS